MKFPIAAALAFVAAFPLPSALAAEVPAGKPADQKVPAMAQPLDMEAIHTRLHRELVKLHEAGRMPPRAELEAQLARKECALDLPAKAGRAMDLATLYKEGRKGVMIVGELRSCGKCGQLHMGGTASGYVIAASGVMVTNYHVIHAEGLAGAEGKPKAKPADKKTPAAAPADGKKAEAPKDAAKDAKGAPIPPAGPMGIGAMDQDGRIHAVRQVLAADKSLDIAIVQLDGEGFTPLPVNAEAQVGEQVAIISHPMRLFYMLSTGIVTNHLRLQEGKADRGPRLCVSAEYGVGSSGGPVFNMKGEVVGMVSSTMPIMTPTRENFPATEQMVMRYCVPMKDILGLIKKPQKK